MTRAGSAEPGPMLHRTVLALSLALAFGAAAAGPAAAQGSKRLALEGGIVHTMVPGEEPRVATVLIADGRVVEVGTDLAIEPGTERVDVSGKHVVPMLIDGYVDFDPDHDALYTATGVAVVRDIGGDRAALLHERDEGERARSSGPSLITALALVDGDPPSTPQAVVLRSAEAAEKLLPILFRDEPDFVSVFLGLQPDVWRKTIELAHQQDLQVWGPVPHAVTLDDALAAGQDGIHFLDALLPKGVIWDIVQPAAFDGPVEKLAASGTVVVPLLAPNALRIVNQGTRPEFGELLALLHPTYEVWWKDELAARIQAMDEARLKVGQRVVEKQGQLLVKLHDAGVRLLPGSGAPQPWLFPGQALLQELALWVRAGLAPEEVLRLATRNAAEILGIEADYGSIQPGAVASMLVTAEDPRTDIEALSRSDLVVLRGRPLERSDLEDLLTSVQEKQAAARAELNRQVEVSPPPTPEGVVILEGVVDSTAFGLRTSSEHFRVVRLPEEDGLAFVGHVVYPQEPGAPPRDMFVSQVTRGGELSEMEIVLRNGEQVMINRGLWAANRWKMVRLFGDQQIDSHSSLSRPVCGELGSVTSLLVLGQAPLSDRFPVVTFHEALTPEMVAWSMELDDHGAHQVRTNLGRKAFRFDDVGAPEKALSVVGTSAIETTLRSSDAHGGPGLPLPPEKRAAIAERRARAASAPAEDAEPGTRDGAAPAEGDDETGGGAEDGRRGL